MEMIKSIINIDKENMKNVKVNISLSNRSFSIYLIIYLEIMYDENVKIIILSRQILPFILNFFLV